MSHSAQPPSSAAGLEVPSGPSAWSDQQGVPRRHSSHSAPRALLLKLRKHPPLLGPQSPLDEGMHPQRHARQPASTPRNEQPRWSTAGGGRHARSLSRPPHEHSPPHPGPPPLTAERNTAALPRGVRRRAEESSRGFHLTAELGPGPGTARRARSHPAPSRSRCPRPGGTAGPAARP